MLAEQRDDRSCQLARLTDFERFTGSRRQIGIPNYTDPQSDEPLL